MPERKTLICWPVSLAGYAPPGSLQDKCSKCGQPVWVAPSSWLIMHDTPRMKILCTPCALAQMKEDKQFEIEAITPAQAEEILEHMDSR
ncbi:hypothetical protein ES705_48722 [subsurface metagenome]